MPDGSIFFMMLSFHFKSVHDIRNKSWNIHASEQLSIKIIHTSIPHAGLLGGGINLSIYKKAGMLDKIAQASNLDWLTKE